MLNSSTSINALLTGSHYWCVNKNGDFDVEYQGLIQVVSQAELAKYHPDLPFAISHQSRLKQKKYKQGNLDGDIVEATRAFYVDGLLAFTNVSGKVVRKVKCDNIELDLKNSKRVYVSGCDIQIDTLTEANRTFEAPVVSGWFRTLVKKIELEACYPGWEHRWNVGQQLGVGGEELSRFVFNLAPAFATTNGAVLDNLSFD